MDAAHARLIPDRRNFPSRSQLISRVRAEFAEMPCLRLTLTQAQRLFGLREDVCARVLDQLVRERALCRENDNRYRFSDATAFGPPATSGERTEWRRARPVRRLSDDS
jgi:hypothetical protein